ncbi:DNRLRE domain-containing protein [Clostridium aestuarii]|uniref:DNRLRE domain-containing protein n=1 Tax=Clostridium aestuarii TaxID=338193 RepID=A0ABT4CWG0_9CLOT|nr:DNRLRE domain-containing protein [Clostridium aestuarii]MCY6483162.1 DNRLRE domain-containing protein [Clostridium aestuarii]
MASVTLEALQDASIYDLEPDRNMGHDTELYCGKNRGGIYRTLLNFDISSIPKAAIIEKAILKLYILRNNVPSVVKQTKVYKLLAGFDEYTVTYSNQPAFHPNPQASVNIISQRDAYLEWNLTSLVTDWYTENTTNYGVMLRGLETENSLTVFPSRTYSLEYKHPILEVSYVIDGIIIEYEPEDIISTGEWAYSIPIPLDNRTANFGIENNGPKNVCVITQLSADKNIWIDSHTSSVSLCTLNPGDNMVLTTNANMAYVRLKCKALECTNPGDYAQIRIYPTIKG